MIQAGVAALYATDDDLLGWISETHVGQLATVAYEAMERARFLECSPPKETRSVKAPIMKEH